jgi:hypothetical protein
VNEFIENIDFYYNQNGLMVLTEKFHLQRGYCCGNGCVHCPFNFINVPEPKKTKLILENEKTSQTN